MDRRQFGRAVGTVLVGLVPIALPQTTSGCEGGGDTGAGTAGQNDPIGKAVEDSKNWNVYLEVECHPANHPWKLSYRCGDEEVRNRPMSGTFARELIQTGSREISIHATQKEQGSLRVSIHVNGVEVDYDMTTEFGGEAWCSYVPGGKLVPKA